MGTPTDPTGRPSSAKRAVPAPPSSGAPAPGPEPKHASGGSTAAHQPTNSLSDLLLNGSSVRTRSTESDIAQFLAHPQGGAANTDDSPTIITKDGAAPAPTPLPLVTSGEVPSIAGRRLGHFELIEAIGAGGMAAVLKARDLDLGRIVALKILPPEAARDPESVTRFKQEARSAAKLDHENIARVYFCGEDQGLHFIAFEFVEGENLRVVIDRRRRLPAAECVRYMIQVAAGLNHAAERGVVHRDIKPSNILVTPDGRAKIVDMGLARYLGSELANGGVTQSGVTLGTFDYISPEQALDPRRADVRSDIYSLGCTFYHALTGRPPVPEGTAARKLRAHQEDDFLDPRELNPAIPDELAAVLARMVAKSPGARYQTPTELIAHLKGLAERLNVADAIANDPAAQAVRAEGRVLPEAPAFRPWWVLAVAAVAVAVVAFVVSTADPGRAPGLQSDPDGFKDPGARGSESVAALKGGHLPVNPSVPLDAAAPVRTVDELVKRLEDPAATATRIVLAPVTFDLSKLSQPVTFQGSSLELRGAPDGRSRVKLPAGVLTVRAQTVTVRGVWFDLTAPADERVAEAGRAAWVGLLADGAERVELTECVFRLADPLLSVAADPRAVGVTRALEGRAPQVVLTRCLFSSGGMALALPAGATALATDCGFAPHAAVVQFDTPGEGAGRSEARFDRCSFMLDPGGSVADAAADLTVRAEDCVFSPVYGRSFFQPNVLEEQSIRGAVIRAREAPFRGVQLVLPAGRASAFFDVSPVRGADRALGFDECRGVTGLTIEDRGKVELRQRPWAKSNSDPVALAAGLNPWVAFKLGIDTEPALFTSDKLRPLGATFHDAEHREDLLAWKHRAYPYPEVRIWPPERPVSAAEVREKVWYPDAPLAEQTPGVFPDLRSLLRVARPDDVILIKHNGDLRVENEELKVASKSAEGDLRVTFRPAKGFNPVLVIQGDVDRDQTLFKLKTGEVAFEDLHFRLAPKEGQTVAAVAVIGGKGCTFRRCVFTLAEEDNSRVAAVHLPDPEKVMKMTPATRPVPKVVFDRCVIRGKGRGVWVEVSRPIELDMSNTLTALDGPVVLAQAGGEAGGGTVSSAKLTRVTVLAGGPVVEMRGGRSADVMRASGLVKLEVDADDCLFVNVPGAGRPLVEIEGVDPTDWKSVLAWRVPAKPNHYANFDPSPAAGVAQIRSGDGSVKEWSWDDWVGNVGEPASSAGVRLGKVKFAAAPTSLKELAAVRPGDLTVDSVMFPDPTDKVAGGADPKTLPALPVAPGPPLEPEDPIPE